MKKKEEELKKDFERNLENALKISLRFLKFRPRTKKEVIDKLKSKDFGLEIIRKTVEELEKMGFLDDEKFAFDWVNERFNFKMLGKKKVIAELKRKGIKDEIIEEAISNFYTPESELENALEFLTKKFAKLKEIEKEKLISILVRQGYSFSLSGKAVDVYLSKKALSD